MLNPSSGEKDGSMGKSAKKDGVITGTLATLILQTS